MKQSVSISAIVTRGERCCAGRMVKWTRVYILVRMFGILDAGMPRQESKDQGKAQVAKGVIARLGSRRQLLRR